MQILGQLGGLPTARLSNNNHYVVVPVNGEKGSNYQSTFVDLKKNKAREEIIGLNDYREGGR